MITHAIDFFKRDFTIDQINLTKQNKREFLCLERSTGLACIAIEVNNQEKEMLLKYSNIKMLGLLNIKSVYEDYYSSLIVQENYR